MGKIILLIDDEPDDALLIESALRKLAREFRLITVADGEEGISYLLGSGRYADRSLFPVPALILLDLKMPRVDGFEFLTWLREHSELLLIPVVVLSGSLRVGDQAQAMKLGAVSFMSKLAEIPELKVELGALLDKWIPPVTP